MWDNAYSNYYYENIIITDLGQKLLQAANVGKTAIAQAQPQQEAVVFRVES